MERMKSEEALKTYEATIPDHRAFRDIAGVNDRNIKEIERIFDVSIRARGGSIKLTGSNSKQIEAARRLLIELFDLIESGVELNGSTARYLAESIQSRPDRSAREALQMSLNIGPARRLTPRSLGQSDYIDALKSADVTIAIGPAGTGKTYLAVAAALESLFSKRSKRIVLARPIVEAGESLGFLPGSLEEKVDPYLRPLRDALIDILDIDRVNAFFESGAIEIAPLAYMRGRTFNNSFIILDEAQNATPRQMKMFLTRLGVGSKALAAGDVTQTDLNQTISESGLVHARAALKGVEGIRFIELTERDVARHPMARRIVRAYDAYDGRASAARGS